MKKSLIRKYRQIDNNINRYLIGLTDNHKWLQSLYKHTILPFRIWIFLKSGGMNSIVMASIRYKDYWEFCKSKGVSESELRELRSDILGCYVMYAIGPVEYFSYNFKDKSHDERRLFLSDRERFYGSAKIMTRKTFEDLKDKYTFYKLTKDFFNRDVCVVQNESDVDSFKSFVEKQPRFFAKPLSGSLGANSGIFLISDFDSLEAAFGFFKNQGSWIFEEIVTQDSRMSVWNTTCVNTLRIPSIIAVDGSHHILQPFIRTGREGAVVDNAGAGGIFAVFDQESGLVITEGVDESFHRYTIHPDSKVQYVGWKIPEWDTLKQLVEKVHRSLPEKHRYVGFDFALSTQGWMLIEGNWGQFVGQIAEQKGVRHRFEELLGLPKDSVIERFV